LNFLHAAPTARFRRVADCAPITSVYPDKQTISEPIGTSRANFGRAHRIFHQHNPNQLESTHRMIPDEASLQ
jgi:hypothetical protein